MVDKKGTLLFLQLFTIIEMSAIHEQILDWWKNVSQMKPINCKLNPKHLNPYPANAQDLISSLFPTVYFSSHSCSESDNVYQNYHLKGGSLNTILKQIMLYTWVQKCSHPYCSKITTIGV